MSKEIRRNYAFEFLMIAMMISNVAIILGIAAGFMRVAAAYPPFVVATLVAIVFYLLAIVFGLRSRPAKDKIDLFEEGRRAT